MTNIFLLGATGYIGGTVLTSLIATYPHFTYTLLIRSPTSATKVKDYYAAKTPNTTLDIRIAHGDLNDSALIEQESKKADVVINCADNDHEGSTIAIVAGLRAAGGKGYLLHTSGSAILLDYATVPYGEAPKEGTKPYNDLEGVSEVTSLPDEAWHRNVDKLVLSAGSASGATGEKKQGLKTAVICPCCIYGEGTGAVNSMSVQVPGLIKTMVGRKKGFMVGKGGSVWNNVHVQDVAAVYVLLVERALAGLTGGEDGGEETWGEKGYYFTENGLHSWKEMSERLAGILFKKGLVGSEEVDSLSAEEVVSMTGEKWSPGVWGSNSWGEARRARKVLGWEAREGDIWGTLVGEAERVMEKIGSGGDMGSVSK